MPLITDLHVQGFRCFAELKVSGLTRVNIVVGANNSGKTVFLEAVQWVADEGCAQTLYEQLTRREEHAAASGHGSGLDACALVAGRPERLATGELFRMTARRGQETGSTVHAAYHVESAPRQIRTGAASLPAGEDAVQTWSGALDIHADRIAKNQSPGDARRRAVYLASDVPRTAGLRDAYARLGSSRARTRAVSAMRLFDPRVEGVEFVPSWLGRPDRFEVLLRGQELGWALGSFGEGFPRALRMALALGEARGGGVMLIDEFENGVHVKAMEPLLAFVLEAARELDVQVFAASHSHDLLDAIASLRARDVALCEDLSVHRLEQGCPRAVRISPEGVLGAIESDIEVR